MTRTRVRNTILEAFKSIPTLTSVTLMDGHAVYDFDGVIMNYTSELTSKRAQDLNDFLEAIALICPLNLEVKRS